MRKLTILAIAIIVSIPLGLMAQDEGFYPYSYARLSYVNGSVFVQRTADLGYEKGEVNLALVQGDKMGTEAGQAEIHFGRRNYFRLADNTKVEFAILPQEGDERIKIHITEGSAYLRVSYLAVDKGIEVHTPDASFYVLEEGLYRFDVRLDRETEVFVREGSLEAAGEDGSVMVRDKETLTAADGRLSGDPEYSYSRDDSFDDWNGSRDAQLAQRSERQNLPSDLEEYEEELDQNGQWVNERPYGNVWVPNVSYDDWRPYLYGRWVWYPVIGWNWVSSESWGWSVYHYGRWHWRFGLGWYWIPQNHWGRPGCIGGRTTATSAGAPSAGTTGPSSSSAITSTIDTTIPISPPITGPCPSSAATISSLPTSPDARSGQANSTVSAEYPSRVSSPGSGRP